MDVKRQSVVDKAIKLGFKKELLDRKPTYAIENLVKEKSCHESSRKSRESSRKSRKSRELSRKSECEDTETVVDMSHITSSENPADQKYNRFKFLVQTKNELMKAISTNAGLKSANQDKLDVDDVFMIDQEIEESQNNLNCVIQEMREIHVWFQEVHAQKKVFYEKLSTRMVDISGKLSQHFNKKMENIDMYLRKMEKEYAS